MKNEIKKLAHSSYKCQYHIVFAPKHRRKNIWAIAKRYRANIEETMRREKGGNTRGKCVRRSYTHAGKYPTAFEYITIHGISQRKKYINDI